MGSVSDTWRLSRSRIRLNTIVGDVTDSARYLSHLAYWIPVNGTNGVKAHIPTLPFLSTTVYNALNPRMEGMRMANSLPYTTTKAPVCCRLCSDGRSNLRCSRDPEYKNLIPCRSGTSGRYCYYARRTASRPRTLQDPPYRGNGRSGQDTPAECRVDA